MQIHKQLWEDMLLMCQALSEEQYRYKTQLLNQSSIGEHLRHAFEFYDCLLNAIPEGFVDYDARPRDKKIEQQCAYAQLKIKQLLEKLDLHSNDRPLILHAREAQNNATATSIERELIYCLDHAIHHQALIKIGLKAIKMSHIVHNDFGVAYSTLRYRSKSKA